MSQPNHLIVQATLVLLVGPIACGPEPEPAGQLATAVSPIFGGEPVPPGQDPAVVSVGNFGGCSGTLIAPRAVLTAAHCAAGVPPTELTVFFGNDISSGEGEWRTVAQAVIHPSFWEVESPFLRNDVAVLILDEEGPAPPIPLIDEAPQEELVGQTARIVGFGVTEEGVFGVKYHVSLPITAVIDEAIEAAEPGSGKDSCAGDSGGPLLIECDGREVVAGVTSFGGECGLGGYYSRVYGPVNTWIHDILVVLDPGICEEPDSQSPALLCLDGPVECGVPLAAPVAADACSAVTASCEVTSGSTSSAGTASCQATDDSGNTSQCGFSFSAVDTRPPLVTTQRIYLGPPNHEYHRVDLRDCVVALTDDCEGDLDIANHGQILVVGSNEAVDSLGDGATCDDAIIESPTSALVRSERSGTGNGRIYLVAFWAFDEAGNADIGTCEVVVGLPGQDDPIFDACRYCTSPDPQLCPAACPGALSLCMSHPQSGVFAGEQTLRPESGALEAPGTDTFRPDYR